MNFLFISVFVFKSLFSCGYWFIPGIWKSRIKQRSMYECDSRKLIRFHLGVSDCTCVY